MKKNTALTICLLLLSSICYSQITEPNQKINVDYSDSASYEPTVFINKNSKKKTVKESNKKTESDDPIKIDSITVPVSVFNSEGKFLIGLQKSNFKIFVDDKEIEDFSISAETEPITIVLLIDTSPSTQYRIEEIQNYALSVVENLKPQDKVLVADFNIKFKIQTEPTNDKELIKKAIRKIKFGDGTSLYDAVENLFENHLNKIEGRKALVLFTDGVDTTSAKSNYEKSLVKVEKNSIPVFPVYFNTMTDQKSLLRSKNKVSSPALSAILGDILKNRPIQGAAGSTLEEYKIGRQYLNDLVLISGGRVINFENLPNAGESVLGQIVQELRLKYYLTFKNTEENQSKQRTKIKVRVNRPNLFVLARGSFIVN